MNTHNRTNYQGIRANMAKLPHLNMPHAGSWFGLPDFGLTEWVGDKVGADTTYQGGSNLVGSQPTPPSAVTQQDLTNSFNQSVPISQLNNNSNTQQADYGLGYTNEGNPIQPRSQDEIDAANREAEIRRQQEALRNEIGSAWDNYLNTLGESGQYITDQKTAQEGIVNKQYEAGESTINTQKAKSLKDIHRTTRQAFQAGNNYLGQLGASDSSASGMMNYAITKQALAQVGDLNQYTNQQLFQLRAEKDQAILGVQNWFSQAQQQLKHQLATGQLNKGQDLANLSRQYLDYAINQVQQIKANAMNRENALLSWAMSNAKTLPQLQSNIAGISRMYNPGQIQLNGMRQNNYSYGGTSSDERYDIYGNPIT